MGPNGGTLLPRALSAAVALPHDGAMRRVMVLITDGEAEVLSRVEYEERLLV